ncbi:MAG: transcription antitermination factor NusB, partial [Bacillota bacterium]
MLQRSLANSQLEARSRALATELASGTLRYRLLVDHIISHFSSRPLERMDPVVRNLLRLGTYQIRFTRIPVYAACDSSVNLVKKLGNPKASSFVNGVLRAVARSLDDVDYPDRDTDPARWISVTESHPLWMVRWYMGHFGFDETLRWCRANNLRPEPVLRVNRLRARPSDLPSEIFPRCDLAPHGVIYRGGGNPADREEYRRGLYSICLDQIKSFIAESVKNDKKWPFIVLIGGEPTLHPDIYEICDLFVNYKKNHSPNTKLT